ncbi:MAG: LLM class F420-dependent oxidoreductase [Acidimicrobiales bacterium]
MRVSGVGVWNIGLRFGDAGEAAEAAAELEELGYTALWIPDAGGDVFGAVEGLLSATRTITVATGILNLWMHTPEETASAHARLVAAHGDRFLVGIGASHAPVVNSQLGEGRYLKPLGAMAAFLDGLDAAGTPLAPESRVLAALGPRMLELAARRAAGVHPYNVTPRHTAIARETLGPSKLVAPEQAVVHSDDPSVARRLGRQHLTHYLELPNYANNLLRLGFTEDDFAEGGSDRLVDAMVAWGDADAIASRIREHQDAGADHVCVQVLSDEGMFPRQAWRDLAPVLTAL